MLKDMLVHDEDFNRAVKSLCRDTDYIYRKLASLEDNNPSRQILEETLAEKLVSSWPTDLGGGADFYSLMTQAADLYQTANQSMNDVSVTYGVTGLCTSASFGLTLAGIVAPAVTLGIAGVTAAGTVVASATQGSIKAANDQAESMSQLARSMGEAREEFDRVWAQQVEEGADQEPQEV